MYIFVSCVCTDDCVWMYLLECACNSWLSVTGLHHITIEPWHLWQPSEASNLIKTEINLLSDLPDEYDKTCSRLMDLDTYQGPENHWSQIRGGRDSRGGVRGSKTQGGLSEAALERCFQAGLGWQPRLGDGPKLHANPPPSPPSFSFTLTPTHSHAQLSVSRFLFWLLPSCLLSLPFSLSRRLSFYFCFLSHTLTHRDLGDIQGCGKASDGALLWCPVGDYRAKKQR